MPKTVADPLLERLCAWGVERVFGYPGDGIDGLIGAFGRPEGRLRFVQARHEEPTAIHPLNGLHDAKADHQPVMATNED